MKKLSMRFLSVLMVAIMIVTLTSVGILVANAETPNVAKIGDTEYATLQQAVDKAADGDTVKLTADIESDAVIAITKAITLDLGGHKLTTTNGWGGLQLKNGCSVKNGTLLHTGRVNAIRAWDVVSLEDLVIEVTDTTEGKTVGGISIQENAAGIDTIKNVTLKGVGLDYGIETYNCGNAQVIGTMENVNIDAVGTGMLLSAPCGTATNCTIKGGISGIDMLLKGTYSVSIDLVNCTVEGGEQAVYAHDEQMGYTYVGSIKLTADEDTDFVNANGVYLKEEIAATTTAEIDDVRNYKVTFISNVEELLAFAQAVNTGNTFKGETVKLTADIDLSSVANWTPIGNGTNYFWGTFDGQGHTISNMTINVNDPSANQYVGLFGGVRKATLKNFKLTNVNIDVVGAKAYAGAVAGIAHSNSENHTTANINLEKITVDGCVINAESKSGSAYVGGFIGNCYPANMTNISVSNLTINPKASGTTFVGGLVGYMQGQNISNNGNTRAYYSLNGLKLKNISINAETVSVLAGGFAGYTYYGYITMEDVTIDGFKADITGTTTSDVCVGGLVGLAHRSDKGHTFTGVEITGIDFVVDNGNGSNTAVGGAVGYSGSPIAYSDCKVSGTITEKCTTTGATVGGFVGQTVSWKQSYEGCTADVDITASNIAGGFVGYNGATATYTDCEAKGSVEAQVAGGFAGGTNNATYINCSYTGESDVPFLAGMVAQVGTTYYKTLAEAVAAAQNGETVKLIGDVVLTDTLTISADKTITLDLNGKTISQTKAQTAAYQMILNDGNLTIKDSVGGGKISYTDTVGGNFISNTITNRGTLTLESGTIENNSSAAVASVGFPYAIDTSIWGEAAEVVVNIKGGTVTCANYSALRIFAQSKTEAITINISGGTVNGRIEVQNPSNKKTDEFVGTLNITGGEINKNNSSKAIMIFGDGSSAKGLDVNISGGALTGEIGYSSYFPVVDFNEEIISGGTFTQDVSAWLAPDTGLVYDEDKGVYTTTQDIWEMHLTDANGEAHWLSPMSGDTLAEILATNKIWYDSLQGTYSFTLKLLTDVKIDDTGIVNFPLTIDLNGHTITGVDVYPVIRVQGGAHVFVKNGTINNDDYVFVLGASDGSSEGNLTIESGKYHGDTTVASVTKGTLTIKGGEFSVDPYEGSYAYLINCIDANYKAGSAKVEIKGGTFYNWNPADNAAENPKANFCADGYLSEEIEEGVFGVRVDKDAQAPIVTITFTDSNTNSEVTLKYPSERFDTIQKLIGTNDYADFVIGAEQHELLAYIADGRASNIVITLHDNIELDAPINFYNKYFQMPAEYDIIVDGKGHTITWADGYTGTLINVENGVDVTLKNLTIDGENAFTFYNDTTTVVDGQNWYTRFVDVGEEDKAINANVIVNAGNLTLDGVTIQNVTIASDSGNGKTANTTTGGYYLMYNDDLAIIKSTGGKVTMDRASITGNAGLVLNAINTETVIENSIIDGNFGCGDKGGIIIANGGTMELNNASICGNKAMARSATVLGVINGAEVAMNGNTRIDNNKHIGVGSNTAGVIVCLEGASQFVMNGGSISNNIGGRAGAIASRWSTADAMIELVSGTIKGNSASNDSWNGADIFLRSPATIGEGMTIEGTIAVNAAPGALEITGGEFDGSLTVADGLTAVISGGTFNYDPSEWLAPNVGLIYDEATGTYGTTKDLYEYNRVNYQTFAEVLAAIKAESKPGFGGNNATPPVVKVLVSHKIDKFITIDTTLILNLNGQTITRDGGTGLYINGTDIVVTIKGEGTVESGAEVLYINAGTVKIENGTFKSTVEKGPAVYVINNGHAEIYGGTFSNANGEFVLNEYDKTRDATTITVYGGTFVGFDPANNAAEGAGTNFVAQNYKSFDNGDGSYTVKNYIEWIKAALLAGNSVTLDRDIVVDGSMIESIPAPTNGNGKYPNYGIFNVVGDYDVTFDLNGHSITYNGHESFVWNGKTYNSCTVAHGVFFANAGADLTVKDSVGTGSVTVYGLASGAYVASPNTTFTITGGTWKNEGCATCGGTNIFLYPLQGGELYIKGGHFDQALDATGESYLIVEHGGSYANSVIDYSKTKVVISGGTFVGMNPEEIKYFNQTADNKLDTTTKPSTNGCALGFVSEKDADGNYGVKPWNYEIHDKDDLVMFAEMANAGNNFSGKTVTLMADIDLGGMTWTPIKNFLGTFNGNKHTISNFHLDATKDHAGFFYRLNFGNGTAIKDLTLSDITATVGNYYVGAFAYFSFAVQDNITIKNFDVTTVSSEANIGGYAGWVEWGHIRNCTIENMTVHAENGAGLIGGLAAVLKADNWLQYNNIDVNGFKVTINDTDDKYAEVGGLVGQTQTGHDAPVFTNCDITGIDVTASGLVTVGGFIARPGAHTTATNCTTEGKIDVTGVTSPDESAGGFFGNLGWNNNESSRGGHKLTNCSADVDIITKIAPAGGFVGSATNENDRNMAATFTNCKALGTITCVEGGTAYIGGFAGDADRGTYKNCSAAQDPFIGYVYAGSKLVNEGSYVASVGSVYYTNFDNALAAAKAGDVKTIVILAPVVITESTTLDLTGLTLDGNGITPAFRVVDGATLTVKDGNFLNATGYLFILGASDGSSAGNVIIEGGSYEARITIASVTKGTLTVLGGEFKIADSEYGATYLLNCIDANYKDGSASIIVKGGRFYGFNPEDNAAEGAGTNFVAQYYESVDNGDGSWTVQKKTLAILTFEGWGGTVEVLYPSDQAETLQDLVDFYLVLNGFTGADYNPVITLYGDVNDTITFTNKDAYGNSYKSADWTLVHNGFTVSNIKVADGYKLIDNGNGTYTATPYVKWVQAELFAGNDVTLEQDIVITDYDLVHAHEWPSNGNGKYTEAHGNGAIFHIIKPGVVLDLNGHSITWDAHDDDYCNARQVSLFMVTITGIAGETSGLTVKDSVGTGKVEVYGMGTGMYVVGVDATGTIAGGTWTNYPCKTCGASNIFLYPSHGGTLEITGGTFEQQGSEYLLGCFGSTKETTDNGVGVDYDSTQIIISGGTFVNFNPENVKFFDAAGSATAPETVNGCELGYMAKDNGNGTYGVEEWDLVIYDIDDLLRFAAMVNEGETFAGKTIKLGANIDLSGIEWAPIGGENVHFAGEFDGQDYAIQNLTQTKGARMGLFGLVEKAYIHNLTMKNVTFVVNENSARVGAIAGNLQYWNVVEDVTIDGINITINGNDGLVGSVAGYVWKSQLGNVDVKNAVVTINGTGNVFGGHTAYGRAHVWDTNVTGNNAHWLDGSVQTIDGTEYVLQNYFVDCDVDGIVIEIIGKDNEVGGFFGSDTYNSHSNYFVNCHVTKLDVTVAAGTSQIVGGFIAWNNGTTSAGTVKGFDGCSVSGTINGANGTYGGFVGQVGGRACEYYNASADVDITCTGTAGGFVGITQQYFTHLYTFTDCDATGDVKGTVAGGFAGKNALGGDGDNINVGYYDCTASGKVNATSIAGGFIGEVSTELPANNWSTVEGKGNLYLNGNVASESEKVTGDATVGYLIGYLDGVANGDAKEGNTLELHLQGNTPDGSDVGTGTGHHINISGDTIVDDVIDYVASITDSNGVTYFATFQAAINAAKADDVIVLHAPVVITEDTTLDLTGLTLDGNGITPAFRVVDEATLTVKGGNFLNATGYLFILGASDGSSAGYLTIEDGSFEAQTTIASVTKGTLTIEGGEFKAAEGTYGATYLLNCIDANYKNGTAKIEVKGGRFYDFNPEDNAAEGEGTDFVPMGYRSSIYGTVDGVDVYDVVELKATIEAGGITYYYPGVENVDNIQEFANYYFLMQNAMGWILGYDYEPVLTIYADVTDEAVLGNTPSDDTSATLPGNVTWTIQTNGFNAEKIKAAEDYVKVVNGDGTITFQKAVAKIGEVTYKTLADAIKAAQAGDTIELIADVTEDVTVNKSITINGANFKYTGNIAVKGSTVAATVKNVNFVDGTGYAITTNTIKSITVEDCTVTNYAAFGFLYANKSTPTVVIKNVTVDGGNYGFHWAYGTTATLENVTMTNVKNGLYIQNYAGKTITLKNCDITSIAIWERTNDTGVPYTGVQTFKFEGTNTVGALEASEYANYVLNAADATLTAPEGFTVTTTVDGSIVKYVDGVYKVVAAIAKNETTGEIYGSLQAAIEAAKTDETVVLLKGIELGWNDTVNTADGKAVLLNVEGKNITLNLNGKTITVEHMATEAANRIYAVVLVADGAGLTVIGEGAIGVTANETTPRVTYLFWKRGTTGYLVIESGEYHMNHSEDSMVYTNGNEIVTIEGGSFTLDNLDDENSPWIFNAQGQGDKHVIVTGGTFNADINRQKWSSEVIVPVTHYTVKNDNGTWTVEKGAVAYVNTGMTTGPHFKAKDIGYATIEEALRAAMDYSDSPVTLLKDVTLKESMTIDKDITVIKGDYAFNVAEGVTLTISAGTYDWDVSQYNIPMHCMVEYDETTKFYTVSRRPLINFIGSSMNIGSNLTLHFFVNANDLIRDDYYALITDEECNTKRVDFAEWKTWSYGVSIPCDSIAAKQMTDVFEIQLFYSNGEEFSVIKSDSVRSYAQRILEDENVSTYAKTAVVDMLNYGAAAQDYFHDYNVEAHGYANNILTDEWKALATPTLPEINDVYHVDDSVKIYYKGASAELTGTLKPSFFFDNLTEGSKLEVVFTDFRGGEHKMSIAYEDMPTRDGLKYFQLDQLSVADINQIVSIDVSVIDSNGTIIGTITDSMASYILRSKNTYASNTELIALYDAILKFSKSAYDYFME